MDWLGLHNEASTGYAWWSGSGSVIVPYLLQVVTFIPIYLYHHNCHQPGCLRIGKHPHNHNKFCKKHHPEEAK